MCACYPLNYFYNLSGKFVPESAVLEMKANFTLPSESDEFVDEIIWVEMDRHQSEPLVGL